MEDRTLYQLCIQALRYARQRDNHLTPAVAVDNIKEAIDTMNYEYKLVTMFQIKREIEEDLYSYDRKYAYVWKDFLNDINTILNQLKEI